ncbi:DUF2922 domain-containing protein [Lapidilactobacillus wuchangensis]|uniref:DUF2922 domain-containing protein n=1 Tax=Lapidilactobacillus wuchangensis TaxID=2486001 RepID=UPI000F7AB119|nr:DUF2922 domain-containing protein [Lapidilactobacillus wuchangensis]
MKQLQLQYQTSQQKKRTLTVNNVNQELEPAVVREQMAAISASQLFKQGDEELYHEPLAANYVERIVTPIFSVKTDVDEK